MKIEIEISDGLAHRLSYNIANDSYDAPELVAPRVQEIVDRYADKPKLLEPKHEAALAILRDRAMERAVQCAKPGDSGYAVARVAEELLDAVLCQR